MTEDDRLKMGTKWQIKIDSRDTILANQVIQESWRLMDTLDQVLSNYKSDSEVSILSKKSGSGEWVKISPYTQEVLQLSRQMWKATDSTFDITIGPVSKIWKRAFQREEWPETEVIDKAQKLVGMHFLEINDQAREARLTQKGMSIDLGGIAKGYAIDKIAASLEAAGLAAYLVEGGGDMRLGAPPRDQSGWHIAYEMVDNKGHLVSVTDTLSDCSIAVSGNEFQHVDWEGKRYQHHINARTSQPQSNLYKVLVISDKCWKADALSTAISILGDNNIDYFDYKGFFIKGNGTYVLEEVSGKL